MDDEFEPYPAPTLLYFGERWDAPLLDGNITQVAVPVGRACLYCGEPIGAGDRGLMRLAVRGTADKPTATQEPAHMECDLRTMIGDVAHLEGRCSCSGHPSSEPDSQTYREESLAVLAHMNQLRATQRLPPM